MRRIFLVCGYQPSVIKKNTIFIDIIISSEYSKYVDKEKFDLIERLKLVHQQSCNSSSFVACDNATTYFSEKALTSYAFEFNCEKFKAVQW